jgi:indole-3-glycerol phosphate synthase
MSDFDVARIVPSTRDLFGALAMRRRGLALVPVVGGDPEAAALEAARLEELEVRALAVPEPESAVVRATSLPVLCAAPRSTVEECQRARYHGADGVVLACGDESTWRNLAASAQSMRMMAMAWVESGDAARALVSWGARAVVLRAPTVAAARLVAQEVPASTVLVAEVAGLDEAGIAELEGAVDAALVERAVFTQPGFAGLVQRFDP